LTSSPSPFIFATMSVTEFTDRAIGPEVLPRLTKEEEDSNIFFCFGGQMYPLGVAREKFNPYVNPASTIEVTGMPHLGKTTMLKQFQTVCEEKGFSLDLQKEESNIGKDPENLDEYNLGFVYSAQAKLFKDGGLPKYNNPVIFDRGILGQIPFIQTSESPCMGPFEYNAALIKDFIVNNYSQWIDALIICNSKTDRYLADPENKFEMDFLRRLSHYYRRLPKTILGYRSKFLSKMPEGYLASPLLIVNLDIKDGPEKFKFDFLRTLGSLLNVE
jgi:hypothetical protein